MPLQRLQQRAQFQAVLSTPARVVTTHFALHGIPTEALRDRRGAPLFAGQGPWLGAVVPKRWARRAVTRNTIKRQVFAVALVVSLPHGAWVVRLRRAFAPQAFPSATSAALKRAVRSELGELLARARLPRGQSVGAPPPGVAA